MPFFQSGQVGVPYQPPDWCRMLGLRFIALYKLVHTIVSLYCLYTSRCSSKLLQRRHLVSYQVLCSIVLSEWACNAHLSTHVLLRLSLLHAYVQQVQCTYLLVNPVSIFAHSICTIVPYSICAHSPM